MGKFALYYMSSFLLVVEYPLAVTLDSLNDSSDGMADMQLNFLRYDASGRKHSPIDVLQSLSVN